MKKHDFEYIKKLFESDGYTLLSNYYVNGSKKLISICPNNHIYSITYYNWKSGYRCKECGVDQRRISILYIKDNLALEGYKLVTKKYKNNKQKLYCRCPRGHTCTITWAGWNSRGDRCNRCGYDSMSLKQTGPNNSQWKGGIARLPYCYEWTNKEYKEYIKYRDDYKCQNPECESDKDLVIHHIDYDKSNCVVDNLITLCRSCNTLANKDRNYHKHFYTNILQN